MDDKRLELLEQAISEVREDVKQLVQQGTVLLVQGATQNAQLKEHMRRTEVAEERLELQEQKLSEHNVFIDRAKFLGAVSGVVGAIILGLHSLGLLELIF